MPLSWVRSLAISNFWQGGSFLLGRLSNGQTYVRVHFRWGFYGDIASIANMQATAANLNTFGIITIVGNGSETPPNPLVTPNDPAPPTQRWLYYETRAPVPRAMDNNAGVVMWTDSPTSEPTDIKAQVLATGMPAGDELDLWATWAAVAPWDSTGSAHVWLQASVLYKT